MGTLGTALPLPRDRRPCSGACFVAYASLVAAQTVELTHRVPAQTPESRARLERRARLLAWIGNIWHFVEFGIALAAGIAAGSVALVGFGIDSLIEAFAGFVIIWLFTGSRGLSAGAERRSQQLIAASYGLLV